MRRHDTSIAMSTHNLFSKYYSPLNGIRLLEEIDFFCTRKQGSIQKLMVTCQKITEVVLKELPLKKSGIIKTSN